MGEGQGEGPVHGEPPFRRNGMLCALEPGLKDYVGRFGSGLKGQPILAQANGLGLGDTIDSQG